MPYLPAFKRFAALCCMFTLVAACGTDASIAPFADAAGDVPLQSALMRGPEVTNLAEDNTDYAAVLYRGVGRMPGNFVVSPYSTAVAMAMIYTGAQSETARQMASAMRWTGGRTWAARPIPRPRPASVPTFLHQANAVWVQEGTPMREEYAPMVAIAFGALAASLDFHTSPLASARRINQWAVEQTNGAVQQMVPEHFIDHTTRLLVTSALRLTASWRTPFNAASTVRARFTDAAGLSRDVPMMRTIQTLRSTSGTNYRAVELPYASEQFSILILVPDDIASFEAQLNASVIDEAVSGLHSSLVDLSLPRFALQSTMSLRSVLQELGMTRAFHKGQADLGGIDRTHHLFLSDVVHHADLRVDEAGTYATAAVGSPGVGHGVRGRVATPFAVDRPFVFMVRDTDSGAPLFMGRVIQP